MAELMAMMGTTAAAAPAAAAGAGAGGIAGGTAGLFGTAGAAAPSAMTQSLLGPAAATPFVTEAAMSPEALAKFLSPETFGLGAPPAGGSSMPWGKMLDAADLMGESKQQGVPMGSRPPGYNPQASMEDQFAAIMGWLKQNGGRV